MPSSCLPCPSVPALQPWSVKGSPDPRQLPFGPGNPRVSGRLCGTTTKGPALLSRFPAAFRRAGIRFLDRPAPSRGLGPPSRSAYRTNARTPTGLSRSARSRPDRGGCSMDPGAAAQAVEVSAYPDRYRNYRPVAEAILAALTRPAGGQGGTPGDPAIPETSRVVFP